MNLFEFMSDSPVVTILVVYFVMQGIVYIAQAFSNKPVNKGDNQE